MLFPSQRPVFVVWLLLFAIFPVFPVVAHGDLHDRILALSAQLTTNQTEPELWLRRADLNRQHGDFAAASNDLAQAAALRPGWPPVALQRARIAFDMSDFSGCIRAATECIQAKPFRDEALMLRARSLVGLKQFADAVADYNTLLAGTNFSYSLPDLYLERARAQAALQRWADAVRGLDEGIARLGLTPALALPAIDYERQRGAFAAALQRLERSQPFLAAADFARIRSELEQLAANHEK